MGTIPNTVIDRIVDPRGLIDLIREVLLDAESVEAPRTSLEHRGTWFGVMPAAGRGFYSVKIVGVYPGNPARGLPLVRGRVLLVDSSTGEVLLEAEAEALTGWRTASATALALGLLGRPGGVLGVIGSGVQAHYHVRVLQSLYDFSELLVYSRSRAKAEGFASKHGGVYVSLDTLLSRSDVVVAATTSTDPVVAGELVKSGALVASVGAPKPVRELDREVLRRAGCILVDTPRVVDESGDVAGDLIGELRIVDLRSALKGAGCRWKEVGVYKSVGTPILDLAAAIHVYERLKLGS